MNKRALLLVVFALMLLMGQWAARAQETAEHTAVLKFEPMEQHGGPVVTLRVNHTLSARFLVDTGTGGCFVSEAFAKKGKFPFIKSPVKWKGVKIDTVEIGPWDMGGEYLVLDGPMETYLREKKVDGIIGQALLQNYAVVLDFAKQECSFTYPGGLTGDALARLGFTGDNTTPIGLLFGGVKGGYYTQTTVGKKQARLLFDTGHWRTTVPNYVAGGLDGKPIFEEDTIRVGGLRKDTVYIVPGLSIGEKRGGRQTVFVARTDDEDNYPLGMDFIAQFNVLLDFPARRLYLCPLSGANPSLLSNGQIRVERMVIGLEKDTWKIIALDTKSPLFAAGLREGDIIEAIDATPLKELLPDQVTVEIMKKGGPTFHVVRIVEGKEQKVTVLLPAMH